MLRKVGGLGWWTITDSCFWTVLGRQGEALLSCRHSEGFPLLTGNINPGWWMLQETLFIRCLKSLVSMSPCWDNRNSSHQTWTSARNWGLDHQTVWQWRLLGSVPTCRTLQLFKGFHAGSQAPFSRRGRDHYRLVCLLRLAQFKSVADNICSIICFEVLFSLSLTLTLCRHCQDVVK